MECCAQTEFSTYTLGNLVRVSAVFKDISGDVQDPTVVNVTITDPTGTDTTYVYETDEEVIKDSVGNYHLDQDVEIAGRWYYRWWSTGTGQASSQSFFEVDSIH